MPRGRSIEREKRLGQIRDWVRAEAPYSVDYLSLVGKISSRLGVGPRVAKEYLEDLQNRAEIKIAYGRVWL